MSEQQLSRGIARGVSWSRHGEAVTTKDREQLERIRERFTRTAQSFAQFALGARGEEAERLAQMAVPGLRDAAPGRPSGPAVQPLRRAPPARIGRMTALCA